MKNSILIPMFLGVIITPSYAIKTSETIDTSSWQHVTIQGNHPTGLSDTVTIPYGGTEISYSGTVSNRL